MRYSEDHKSAVRQKIIETAARVFREEGLHAVSIPAIMRELGLTHGGFYAHFDDRDDLVACAIDFAADATGDAVFARAEDLAHAVNTYVSAEHVNDPGHGCVVAALGVEAGRHSGAVRRASTRAATGLIQCVADQASGGAIDDDVLALVSQMVGAVVLARLVDNPGMQARLLAAVRLPS